MGTFSVDQEIGDPNGLRYAAVDVLVDTVATYTTVSESLAGEVGSWPALSTANFVLAGRQPDAEGDWADMGQARGRTVHCARRLWSMSNARPLLGAVTLEIFRLGIDPVRMRLVPVDGDRRVQVGVVGGAV